MAFYLSYSADVGELYLCEVRVPCEEKSINDQELVVNRKEKTSV